MAVDSPKRNYKNPSACASAFGRFFYAVDSLIYFSQVIISPSDAGRCYQANDPTSSEIPDLLDTDGGVIELEDSRRIKRIIVYRSGILVFAANGVWYISNPDGGFKATAFNVEKITDRGLDATKSVIEGDSIVYYFSNNGIMQIGSNEFNVLAAVDITESTIRSYYLSNIAGKKFNGVYDEALQQCVWWSPSIDNVGLIYDTRLQAFYPQKSNSPNVRVESPFNIVNASYWISALETGNSLSYSFARFTNKQFKDFGTDQDAYLISGPETLGKFANKKSVTQAKVFFRKTEKQVTGYENGSYTYDTPSGCLFQARWDFDNSGAYSKFVGLTGNTGVGKEMQLYKPMQRGFIPDEFPYNFDTGEALLSKKFNIRGNGDAVQFVFKAEPEKDLQLLGYSVNYTMRGRM